MGSLSTPTVSFFPVEYIYFSATANVQITAGASKQAHPQALTDVYEWLAPSLCYHRHGAPRHTQVK